MKEFIRQLSSKVKSIYLIWILIHLIFLFALGNGLLHFTYTGIFSFYYNEAFYPFAGLHNRVFDLDTYDYTEFIVYLVSPIIIFYAAYLWKKKPNSN